ncbi:MAG: hypothetical protein ACLPVF_13120 [Acidimicrobiales bacterium]
MLPLTTRRRARRKTVSRRVVVLGGAVLLTVLIIGGLTQVSRNSGPYDANVNRSFAAQVSAVAAASNQTAASLRRLMGSLATQDRGMLQAELDALVQQTAQQQSQAATSGTPAPSGQIAGLSATVFADRARAVSEVRSALDGLLGMQDAPVDASPALLSSGEATDRIAAAGALLARADQDSATVRAPLARSPGHAAVPASRWVTNGQEWQAGAVATLVDQVVASTSLQATQQLVLSAVGISPPALPSPSGVPAPTSILSPTDSLTVSPVLTNLGTVDEPRGTVHITLTAVSSGRAVAVRRVAAVAASRSVALTPATFVVKPGLTYQLTVAIALPAAQTSTAQTDLTWVLQIAPNASPTTAAG